MNGKFVPKIRSRQISVRRLMPSERAQRAVWNSDLVTYRKRYGGPPPDKYMPKRSPYSPGMFPLCSPPRRG
jgi:hypothetical protein